jgi:hypothetical protein
MNLTILTILFTYEKNIYLHINFEVTNITNIKLSSNKFREIKK